MTQALDRDELMEMTYAELRAGYAAMFGEPSRSPNKVWMVNKMVEASSRLPAPATTPPTSPSDATAVAAPAAVGHVASEAIHPPAGPPRSESLTVAIPEPERTTAAMPAPVEVLALSVVTADIAPGEAEDAPGPARVEARLDDVAQALPIVSMAAPSEVVATCVTDEAPVSERQPETEPAPSTVTAAAVLPAPESGARAVGTDVPHEPSSSVAGAVPAAGTPSKDKGRYRGMSVEELRRAYELVVGRATSSVDVSYLRWKILQAEKGVVPVGPIAPGHRREGVRKDEEKTLPLTIPAAAVVAVDEAWARQGFKSRMAFLRTAIREALIKRGEHGSAGHFPDSTASNG